MFNKIFLKITITVVLLLGAMVFLYAQNNGPYFKDAINEKREKFYKQIVKEINKKLSLPLNTENEESWAAAFDAINLVKYSSPFVDAKIDFAVKNLDKKSTPFIQALLQLLHNEYQKKYAAQIKKLYFASKNNVTTMTMAARYLQNVMSITDAIIMQNNIPPSADNNKDIAIINALNMELFDFGKNYKLPSLKPFFKPNYLPGQVLVFSFQRKDRNYPGLAIVRKADGSFMKINDSTYFSVAQLARSASNMPSYISMGNTPQGIFRMDGFDTSKSYFIGPTTNIQLTLPFEYKASHFFGDSTLADSAFSLNLYQNLLPKNFKNIDAMFGTWYAGQAGRNEIIAHGTTVDPQFYKNKTYYPFTPTAGCLTTTEFWNGKTGYLHKSDQQLFTQMVKQAGGTKGYFILIELDDKKAPVVLANIISYLK